MANEREEVLDNETGEKKGEVYFATHRFFATDAETGEPEIDEIIRRSRSKSFLEQQQENRSRKVKTRRNPIHGFYIENKEIRSNVVKEVIIFKRKNVGPIVFMLPTLLICPAWASILCVLGEACMHIWSHKRNRRKKNAEVEYRSPLHLISSQFCIHCRSQKLRQKISEIQDKRTLRRRIIYPNFLGRVIH